MYDKYNLDLDFANRIPSHSDVPSDAEGLQVQYVTETDDGVIIETYGTDGHICHGQCMRMGMDDYKICPNCHSVKFDGTPLVNE